MKRLTALIARPQLLSPDTLEQLQLELKEAREQSNSLMKALNTVFMISVTNELGEIRYVNEHYCKISGYSRPELMGQKFNLMECSGIEKNEFPDILASIENKGLWQDDVMQRTKDGNIFWVDAMVTPLVIKRETTKKYITVMQVVTERKKVEEELLVANMELEAFNFTLSHDLRTPLRAMEIFTELVMKKITDNSLKTMLVKALMAAKEMTDMIAKMLELSKIGWTPHEKVNINMEALVHEVFETQRLLCKGKQINLKLNNLPHFNGDKTLIKAVWGNLISNAIKYSFRQESIMIEIQAETKGSKTIYSIKDNGVGFDMKNKDKLFKTFSRLHTSADFPGMGAGLAIVDKIIKVHGGKVRATSSPGEGATFYFSLPIEKLAC